MIEEKANGYFGTISPDCVSRTLALLVSEKRFGMGGFMLRNLKIERIEEYIKDELEYALHTLIPAEEMKEETHTVSVEYPETLWEMFKEEFFPVWLKRKYPVKYKTKKETVRFTAYNLYPEFPVFMPEQCKNGRQVIQKNVEYVGWEKE